METLESIEDMLKMGVWFYFGNWLDRIDLPEFN